MFHPEAFNQERMAALADMGRDWIQELRSGFSFWLAKGRVVGEMRQDLDDLFDKFTEDKPDPSTGRSNSKLYYDADVPILDTQVSRLSLQVNDTRHMSESFFWASG